ncbi:MAG: hypothetical protein K2L19_03860 [Eubacterium sp.]|nr:hypothetical protein [Eubacterium sp.]
MNLEDINLESFIDIIVACTSIISIFIAAKALKVSADTTKIQMQHNMLSMKPVCEIYTANYDDGYLAVEIQNKGLGLMCIDSIAFIDKQGIAHKQLIACVSEKTNLSYLFLEENKVIMAGEKLKLIKGNNLTNNERERIVDELKGIQVHIEYKDVYFNKYIYEDYIKFVDCWQYC